MPTTPKVLPTKRAYWHQFTYFACQVGLGRKTFTVPGYYLCREQFLGALQRQLFMHSQINNVLRRSFILKYGVGWSAVQHNYRCAKRIGFDQLHKTNLIYARIGEGYYNQDPDIGRMLDRFVGVMCAALFPGTKVSGYKGAKLKEFPDNKVFFEYRLPGKVMFHPAILHLLTGLGRDALTMYGLGNQEYFLPAASDEEVAEALNGNGKLALEIVECLIPNLQVTSRSFSKPEHARMIRHLHSVGVKKAYLEGTSVQRVWRLHTQVSLHGGLRSFYWDDPGSDNFSTTKHRVAVRV